MISRIPILDAASCDLALLSARYNFTARNRAGATELVWNGKQVMDRGWRGIMDGMIRHAIISNDSVVNFLAWVCGC